MQGVGTPKAEARIRPMAQFVTITCG